MVLWRQASFVCRPVVTNASELLGLDAFQLSEVLTQRSIILRGEEICSPLTIEQVRRMHLCDQSLKQQNTHPNTPYFSVTGCGFPRLRCHGAVLAVLLLDHP